MFQDKNTGNQAVMGGFAGCVLGEVLFCLVYFLEMFFKSAYDWGLVKLLSWCGAWVFILGLLAIAGGFAIRFLAGQDILDAVGAGCAGLLALLRIIGRFRTFGLPKWLGTYVCGILILGLFAVPAIRALKKSNMPWCAMCAAAGLWIAFLEKPIFNWIAPSPLNLRFLYYLILMVFTVTIVGCWGIGLLASKETND